MCMSHILLTMAGHWVQFQVGFVLCYLPGTNTPSHYKVTVKIMGFVNVAYVCWSMFCVCVSVCGHAHKCKCVCMHVHIN